MKVQVINKSKNKLPKYETAYSAGMDVRADFSRVTPENPIKLYGEGKYQFPTDEKGSKGILTLAPFSRALIPTGLFVAIPEGFELQVRMRSGLALKKGLNLANSIGTIDADYRNEVGIILINNSKEYVSIEDGERCAQLVLNKVEQIDWLPVTNLDGPDRGGGLGHTGTK